MYGAAGFKLTTTRSWVFSWNRNTKLSTAINKFTTYYTMLKLGKHFYWSKLVTWLAAANQIALFQSILATPF